MNQAAADGRNVGDWERVASGFGGALLLGYGLARRPSVASALMAAGGVLLLERGLTGHCSIYDLLGLNSREEHARPDADTDAQRYGKRGAHSIRDEIERASDESFPASDPPSWTPHKAGSPVV